jgi:hypothetical protein
MSYINILLSRLENKWTIAAMKYECKVQFTFNKPFKMKEREKKSQ